MDKKKIKILVMKIETAYDDLYGEIHDTDATELHDAVDGAIEAWERFVLSLANADDGDEDRAAGHYIVIRENYSPDVALTDDQMDAMCGAEEEWLDAYSPDGYEFRVRPARPSEAAGIYRERADGQRQILGYSIPVPEQVNDLLIQSWEIGAEALDE